MTRKEWSSLFIYFICSSEFQCKVATKYSEPDSKAHIAHWQLSKSIYTHNRIWSHDNVHTDANEWVKRGENSSAILS